MITSALVILFASVFVIALILFAVYIGSQRTEKTQTKSNVLKVGQVFLAWIILITLAASTDVLQRTNSLPPPMFLLMLLTLIYSIAFAASRIGKMLSESLSYAVLIGFHGFRLLAEYGIHLGFEEGHASPFLTWYGGNWDLISAVSALLVACILVWKPNRILAGIWSVVGFLLLLNVMARGMLSFPSPVQQLFAEPTNIWVSYFPYIYLPCILVWAAFTGHLILFRKLFRK